MDRGSDGVVEDLVVAGGLVAAAVITWWLLGHHLLRMAAIASAVLSVPAALLADISGSVGIPVLTPWLLVPSQAARDLLFSVSVGELGSHAWLLVPGGRNAALFALPLLVVATRSAARLRPDLRYRTRHSLGSVTAEQARVWPAAHRPLLRNLADDSEPETSVDAARAQQVRRAHDYARIMGGGRDRLPVLTPPPAGHPRPSPSELGQLDLEAAGWRPAEGESLEMTAILLARDRWPEAEALLRLAGWTRNSEEDVTGWHDRFVELSAAGRWDEAMLACFLAGCTEERPATGSFLLTPFPDHPSPPPLGRALRPEEWLDARCLRDGDGDCDPHAVEAHLAGQLTRPFSVGRLRIHERALVACIAGFRGDDSRGLIDDLSVALAACSEPGDVHRTLHDRPELLQRIDDLLTRHRSLIEELAKGHFWLETALTEIWRAGRQGGGILAPAALLWLKPEDRTLWYSVQCCGGNVVIEAAGVHAHHLAERQYRRPLPVPNVRQAVAALKDVYLDQSEERIRSRQQAGRPEFRIDDRPGEEMN